MRKTMTRWKKILSAVLVATMLITLIPDVSFTSYATEETEEEFCTDEMEEALEDLKTGEYVEGESGEIYSTEKNEEEESGIIDSTEESEEEESGIIDSTEESEEEESENVNGTEETDEEESEEISETEKYEEKSEEPSETEVIEESEESTEMEEESSESAETQEATETETAFEPEEETTEESVTEETTEETTELVTEDVVVMEEVSLYAAQNSYVSVKNGTHYTTYEFTTRLNQADNQDIPGAVTYIIPDDVRQNTLKVTSTNGYEPIVKIGDKILSPSGEPEVIVNKDKISVTATYQVNTADIASKTITIAEQHKTVKLKVKYYNNNGNKYIALDTIVNGRAQKPIETIDGRDTYAINYGENVELVPQGLLGYSITSVKVGEREIKGKDGKYTLKLYEDTEVTIEHIGDIQCNINMITKDIGKNPFTTTWDGYSFKETINYHGKYTIYAQNVETDEKLKIDAGTVKVITNKKHSVRTEINEAEGTIVLWPEENPDELITVSFTAQGKEFSATLKTRKAVQSIKVKAARNGVLTHGVGFGGYYDVIVSPAGADTSSVRIRYEEGTKVRNVTYYDDKIYIEKCRNNAVTNVQFAEYNAKTYKPTIIGKVTVKISDDNIKKAKPTVKVKYITDTEMRLSVDRPEEFKDKPDEFMNRFKVIYHAKAEAITSDSKPLQKNMKQSVEGYYDEKTQEIVLRLAKDGVAAGKGVAQDYKVTVSFVQNMEFSDGEVITVDGAEPIFSAPVELKVSTRNPYYEDKLTLNRKVDKIYGDDRPVCVAEAQFSKNASYCMLRNPTVISVPSNVENKEVIQNRLTDLLEIVDNTKLYVNSFEARFCNYDYSGIPVGKYKVQVEALATDGMEPAKATVEFTVVDPYGEVKIQFPSHKLIKQPGKAASMTGTVQWIKKGAYKKMNWVVEPAFYRYQNPKA